MPETARTDNPALPRPGAQALALPGGGVLALPWSGAEWRGIVGRALAHEVAQRRLFPWIAVFFGLGIVLFFRADGQPALWAPFAGLVLSSAAAFGLRRSLGALAVAVAIAALFAGFAAGTLRSRSVAAPVLDRVTIAPIRAFVEATEERPQGRRLLLRVVDLEGVKPGHRPDHVRVSVRGGEVFSAGEYIAAKARLLPPPQPAWPGGYDFGRDAYFRGIGAVGSLLGPVRRLDPPVPPGWSQTLTAGIDRARNGLTRRIADSIGGPAGGVGAALVTGKRGLIPERTNDVLRAAGIYHIVSISGLHMVLAAGTVFWLVRALLALTPFVALLWPIKKIAAIAAMLGAVAYCVFSGAEVATERSLVMTLVMFGAILADRPALSIRNLAIAALIVLAREPEALLGPSFQMSYGAVAALTAAAPLLRLSGFDARASGPVARAWRWAVRSGLGLVGTTLVASIATAPFSAYHFQTINPYGLIGNALALPLVSVVVMPCAVIGVLAYPFGLDGPIWQIMGLAVDQVLRVSAWVGAMSGSTLTVPALSVSAFALLSLALVVATLCASSLRWLALLPVGAGLAFAVPHRFDVFVDRDGQGAAIRTAEGRLAVLGRVSPFVAEQWLRADGDGRDGRDPSLTESTRCDPAGCTAETRTGRPVALVRDISAFTDDCRRAAIIITRLAAPPRCGAGLVLDRKALAERGATALRFREDGTIEIDSVRKGRETLALGVTEDRSEPSRRDRPQQAMPVPEQDIPGDDVSSDEPD